MADIKRRGPDVIVLAVSLTVRSVAKTGRLVVVDEAPLTGGFATAIAGMVAERGFWSLKAPIQRSRPRRRAGGLQHAVGEIHHA